MSFSRWLGLSLFYALAMLYVVGAVWCFVGNRVMVGALVGLPFTVICLLAALVFVACAVAFIPRRLDRILVHSALQFNLGMAGTGFLIIQLGDNRGFILIALMPINLLLDLYFLNKYLHSSGWKEW